MKLTLIGAAVLTTIALSACGPAGLTAHYSPAPAPPAPAPIITTTTHGTIGTFGATGEKGVPFRIVIK